MWPWLLLALPGLWLVLWLVGLRASARAEAAAPARGQRLIINGSPLHLRVMGAKAGTAPDLVLIHGSNGHTADLSFSLAARLAPHFRLYLVDRPGLGYSAARAPDGDSLRAQARQIADAVATLGAHKPLVMGHSYGGAVALAWACYMPDRVAALVPVAAPSHPWTTALDPLYRLGAHPILGPLLLPLLPALVPEAYLERTLSEVFAPNPVPDGYFQHFVPKLALRYRSMRATALQRANLLDEITAMAPLYPKLTLPIESLHGSADTIVGLHIHAEPLCKAAPTTRLTRLTGHGHMIQHSAEDAVVAALLRAAKRAGLHPKA
ncbi:alpha/beta hydrolase [uncultured Lentibacter sp.]|jgi:pimeloyl-ACP methyl ester carboxylesterase|uniref:alpha/beta fold hydrolase n=1 Tax=uncultured Lentibacter sp. TaxID=1659309 RepID=UPI0026101EDF|nr:alpha/beta hydrolase [uncultured Lentibacter sp.]